jgi:hypothetical protein
MQQLSNTAAQPYDFFDLFARVSQADYLKLDVRVTSKNGRPSAGDRIVLIDASTGEDVSVALNDFEAEALRLRLEQDYPQQKCPKHQPYQRGRKIWDTWRDCTCTAVFVSRLRAAAVLAEANRGVESRVGAQQDEGWR